MADDNPSESPRKQARAQRAKKRQDDVLEPDDEPSKPEPVEPPAGAAKRSEDTDTGDRPDRQRETSPEVDDDPIARGEAWLEELFERMKLDLEADGSRDGDDLVFDVTGADADDLIGRSRRSPRLLSSIQVLLSEHLGDVGGVLVDVGGFKKKRQSQLVGVADRLGETVQRIERSLTVAGLNSYERRVIHQRLADVDGVNTESVGHGIFRKLRVLAEK